VTTLIEKEKVMKSKTFLVLTIISVLLVSVLATGATSPIKGGVPVRVPNAPDAECINSSTDKVWLTLYRIVETKRSGFFTNENQAEIIVTVKVQSDPQTASPLSFPLSVKVNTANYGKSGQVSLPIEYTLVSGLPLTQKQTDKTVSYTGFSVDTTLVNLRSQNGLGSAISALSSLTGDNKLPIPSNPYSEAATFLFGFATKAIQNDITAKNANDKYSTASLAMNFSSDASCRGGPTAEGFERTGTKAILMEEGNRADAAYVPIDQVNDYCWTADTTPSFVLKAAKKVAGKACGDSSYDALYAPIANDFIAYFLQKQTMSTKLGRNTALAKDKKNAKKLCDALGMSNNCLAAK
jgi:hypothetical protein